MDVRGQSQGHWLMAPSTSSVASAKRTDDWLLSTKVASTAGKNYRRSYGERSGSRVDLRQDTAVRAAMFTFTVTGRVVTDTLTTGGVWKAIRLFDTLILELRGQVDETVRICVTFRPPPEVSSWRYVTFRTYDFFVTIDYGDMLWAPGWMQRGRVKRVWATGTREGKGLDGDTMSQRIAGAKGVRRIHASTLRSTCHRTRCGTKTFWGAGPSGIGARTCFRICPPYLLRPERRHLPGEPRNSYQPLQPQGKRVLSGID